MTRPAVPPAVLAKLRTLCLGLPEVVEKVAWVGTRWCVRGKNFSHVLMIDGGWPPAYARAAGRLGPACVMTFRLPGSKAGQPRFASAPYFRPFWWANIAGVVIEGGIDWGGVEVLIAESYCVLAPKKLAALVTIVGH
jgi:hypothetical protein